jgi:hypothetical protein
MAVVCALRFGEHAGAICADEAYWFLRRRKSFFTEHLHPLLDDEAAEDLGMAVVYGGTGLPSFHYEAACRVRKRVRELLAKRAEEKARAQLAGVEAISRLALNELHGVIGRRVNDALKFMYGFTRDEFIQGYFERDGKRYEIAQESVKKTAKSWISSKDPHPLAKPIHKNFAVIVGYDPQLGFQAFHVNGEKAILATVSGGFEAIGPGKYASAQEFARFWNHKTVSQRRGELNRVEGLAVLIAAAQRAGEYYHEAGGHLQIMLIDGKKPTHAERLRELADHRAKLAGELVTAWEWGEIGKADCYELLDGLAFQGAELDEVEEALFARAKDAQRLERIFRGYKVDATAPDVPPAWKPSRRKTRRSGKGK